MTETTYKAKAQAAASVTLLIHPGTPAQRATFTVSADRPDQQANALTKTRAKHGTAPLAWLTPDGHTTEVLA